MIRNTVCSIELIEAGKDDTKAKHAHTIRRRIQKYFRNCGLSFNKNSQRKPFMDRIKCRVVESGLRPALQLSKVRQVVLQKLYLFFSGYMKITDLSDEYNKYFIPKKLKFQFPAQSCKLQKPKCRDYGESVAITL